MRRLLPLSALLTLPLLAACVQNQPPAAAPQPVTTAMTCAKPAQPAKEVQFYFGRKTGDGGRFSDAEWRQFLDEVVTPTFPDGMTAWDAEGRSGGHLVGKTYPEGSKVLVLFIFDETDLKQRIQTVADAYKKRAKQKSVLVVETETCISFL